MMRKILLLGGVLAFVAIIALAALLGIGKAASTNTCTYVAPGQPDCLTVTAPLYVTSGQTGLAAAKFQNKFGTATATHTVITFNALPTGVSATSVSGSPGATCSLTTLSCSFGNVKAGDTVRMFLQFTSSAAATSTPLNISATVSYAEGNGTNGNDAFTATGSFLSVTGSDHAGYCTTATKKFVKNKQVALLSATDASGQTVTIETLDHLANGDPCTPIAAAVEPKGDAPITTDISIVAFQTTGTVTLLFPLSEVPSPFILKELAIDGSGQWIPLGDCPTIVAGTDSCKVSQTNVTINGTKYVQDVLTVVGQPPDGHYGG
jgi:hypothetical protein